MLLSRSSILESAFMGFMLTTVIKDEQCEPPRGTAPSRGLGVIKQVLEGLVECGSEVFLT